MLDKWYFGWGDKKFGPFSGAQLKDQGVLGKLQPTDTVWKEGMDKGVLAETVKNLFPAPEAEAVPANAAIAVADDHSSSLPASPALSAPIPHMAPLTEYLLPHGNQGAAAAKLEPWLTAMPGQPTLDEPFQEIVPDGLMLKGIPEQNDSGIPVSPAPIHSPGLGKMAEGELETSSALTRATGQKLKSPANTNHHRPNTQNTPTRKGRAIGVKGAAISSQDGEYVQYRKKCLKCGYEDASRSSMRIKNGASRENFFCPKCRKLGEVIIQGII